MRKSNPINIVDKITPSRFLKKQQSYSSINFPQLSKRKQQDDVKRSIPQKKRLVLPEKVPTNKKTFATIASAIPNLPTNDSADKTLVHTSHHSAIFSSQKKNEISATHLPSSPLFNLTKDEPIVSLGMHKLSLFDPETQQAQSEQKNNNLLIKQKFLECITHLIKAMDSQLNGPHFSQFLREIARLHRKKATAWDASIARSLYEKSLALYPHNKQTQIELDFLYKMQKHLLNTKSKTKQLSVEHAICRQIGSKHFFYNAINTYLVTVNRNAANSFHELLKKIITVFNEKKFLALFPVNEYFSAEQKLEMQSFLLDALRIINPPLSSFSYQHGAKRI